MYGETRPETHAYVGSGLGITRVETAGGQVGRFSLEKRCSARDIAGANGEIAVATDEAVLLSTSDGFAASGFGPATAVGYDADGPLAAGDGRVARYADGEWQLVCRIEDVRAIDGRLVAAESGVYALPDCTRLGLAGVTDVTEGYAATADGLYERAGGVVDGSDPETGGTTPAGDGWTETRSGEHGVVARDGGRVHAADVDTLVELADGGWRECPLPVRERVVDLCYGADTYAVTEDGTFLVETADESTADGRGGWRGRSLGLPGVVGVAVA